MPLPHDGAFDRQSTRSSAFVLRCWQTRHQYQLSCYMRLLRATVSICWSHWWDMQQEICAIAKMTAHWVIFILHFIFYFLCFMYDFIINILRLIYECLFSIILMVICSNRPCEWSGQIWSPYTGTSPVSEIIAIGVFVGAVNPNPGEEEFLGGRGWYHSKERWWLSIGPP